METKKMYTALGLMSGTSLDGLDIVKVKFFQEFQWKYEVLQAKTIAYPGRIKNMLRDSMNMSGYDLKLLDNELGRFFGEKIIEFFPEIEDVDYIASHGHTVFHEPSKQLTLQIGSGAEIAALTGKRVICDFRSLDVAMGGQGAPLVPAGDELLFAEYDICLNLGGFGNLSYTENGKRKAFDVCPVNMALNYYSQMLFNKEFDFNGDLGRRGKMNQFLLTQLNDVNFYKQKGPKSLGKEWFETEFLPIISIQTDSDDLLHTLYHHISEMLARALNKTNGQTVLVTGGGALNTYLLELLSLKITKKIVVPDIQTLNFKEAIIFAFLGLMRLKNKPNCKKSVTGARENVLGGVIIQ